MRRIYRGCKFIEAKKTYTHENSWFCIDSLTEKILGRVYKTRKNPYVIEFYRDAVIRTSTLKAVEHFLGQLE